MILVQVAPLRTLGVSHLQARRGEDERGEQTLDPQCMATLITDRASEDGRWARRWPPPVYEDPVQMT